MPILSHVRFMVTFPSVPVQRLVDDWARSLKEKAPTVYEKILARIPTPDKFQELIGQPSSTGFQPFVNDDFINRAGENATAIKQSQASNLKRSYEKYLQKIIHAFEIVDGEEGKRFRQMVNRMKTAFASGIASRTLPFTGTKIEGRGPAPLTALWLVKSITVLDQLRAGDAVLEGGPFRICSPEKAPAFKAALTGRLVQAGAGIVKANYAEDTISAQNDRINSLILGFIDPALGLEPFATGGASHVDFVKDEAEQLFLDVQVSAV